ncbi:MAG: type VI secretion system protein TssL, partial [Gammaproteobacteria bacterium]|nr:type VI secretion system protein TssL [Gammaproteobacteria bacterium]
MGAPPPEPEKKCPPGLPAWLATFGDLMSLLLCFFVLLLSFATIDAKKMKKVVS